MGERAGDIIKQILRRAERTAAHFLHQWLHFQLSVSPSRMLSQLINNAYVAPSTLFANMIQSIAQVSETPV